MYGNISGSRGSGLRVGLLFFAHVYLYMYARLRVEGLGHQNYGYLFRGPHNKDCNILGSILSPPLLKTSIFYMCTDKSKHYTGAE